MAFIGYLPNIISTRHHHGIFSGLVGFLGWLDFWVGWISGLVGFLGWLDFWVGWLLISQALVGWRAYQAGFYSTFSYVILRYPQFCATTIWSGSRICDTVPGSRSLWWVVVAIKRYARRHVSVRNALSHMQ